MTQAAKTAVITGITGQDGSYLAELLLEKGYKVVGVVRRLSTPNTERIGHLEGKIELAQALKGANVVFTLIKDGDHRLSRPQDIARVIAAVADVS